MQLSTKDWQYFLANFEKLKKKDLIILRLYINFMKISINPNETTDTDFLTGLKSYLETNQLEKLDPQKQFIISNENRQNIKDLLVKLQNEK